MNILLINPPRSPRNALLDHAPTDARRFIHRKLIGPPLGLLAIAAGINDHEVTFLDMKGQYDLDPASPPPEQLALQWVEKSKPDVVGLTIITSEFNAATSIAASIRRANPEVLLVAGGLHPTLCPNDFSSGPFDVVFIGQDGDRFRQIVESRAKRGSFDHIEGLFVNSGGEFRKTRPVTIESDLTGKNFVRPDRSFLKPWLSTYFVGKNNGPATYLYTSLGCPFKCSFCSIWPQFHGCYFQREVESVIDELKALDDYPVVRFADANSIVDTSFAERLFDRIEQESIRKEYVMDLRTDMIAAHPKLIARMAKAGLKVVISGFESFRDEELKTYAKSTSAITIRTAIEILHDNDIMIRGNYVIPPHYSRSDFAALAEYASSYPVAYAGYTVLTPMPGTGLHKTMKPDIIDLDLDKYNFFNCVLKTALPLEEFYREIGRLWTIKKGTDVI